VGGDLIIAGGNVTVNSPIGGDIKIIGGTVTINSAVAGVVDIRVKEQLVFGPNAVVNAQINYSGPKEAVISEGAKVSVVNFTKVSNAFNTKAFLGFGVIIDLIAWLIAALVLFALAKNRIKLGLAGIKDKPWLSLGVGLIGVVVVPAVIVILFSSIIGYYLGLITTLWYALVLLVGLLLGAIMVGSWIMKYVNKTQELPLNWISVIVGVVVLKVLFLIPVVGWIIALLLTLVSIGTMLRMAKYEIKRNRE
jgi:MFS family permease